MICHALPRIAGLLFACGLLTSAATAATPAPTPKTQVLIVTGVDLHNWRETTPVLAEQIAQDPRLEVRVVQDPHFLDSAALDRYDVIVLHFADWKAPSPGEAAGANLKRVVEAGKGLVLVHFACGAFQDWPEFVNLAGRVYSRELRPHDRRGPFHVDITAPNHPITKGLQPFDTDDELYTCLSGDRPIEVLATAKSNVDGKDYPMAFVLQCGKGRVFHCALGHDTKALKPAAVGELFRRGTAWAAGLDVVGDK
jgi:uncharacterized protein